MNRLLVVHAWTRISGAQPLTRQCPQAMHRSRGLALLFAVVCGLWMAESRGQTEPAAQASAPQSESEALPPRAPEETTLEVADPIGEASALALLMARDHVSCTVEYIGGNYATLTVETWSMTITAANALERLGIVSPDGTYYWPPVVRIHFTRSDPSRSP